MMSVNRARGYVLVLTLWALAAISIGAAYLASQTSHGSESARAWRARVDAMQAVGDARSELLFRAAVSPFTEYGIGVDNTAVRLDGTLYRSDGAFIQLQDDAGLLSINPVDRRRIAALLNTYGVSADEQARMLDALQDYEEPGDTHRLNAPSKGDYADLALPPPRDAPLVDPQELQRVAAWASHPELFRGGKPITDMLAVGLPQFNNANTAPPKVLEAWLGIGPAQARAIVQSRQRTPIVSGGTLAAIARIDPATFVLQVVGAPSHAFSITLQAPGLPWRERWHVTLTPNALPAPWRVDYTAALPADAKPPPLDAPSLPPRQLHFVEPPKAFGIGLLQ